MSIYPNSKKMPEFLLICSLLMLLSISPCMAQEKKKQQTESQDIIDLSLEDLLQVTVQSTTKTDISLRQAPGTIYRFEQKDFEAYGIQSIDDLYWYIPNMQPFRYKKYNDLGIRGVLERFNNRVQHQVDGIITMNGYYNHTELNEFYPLEWIDNLEVILGPGSALYGANAFSGIVNMKLAGFSEKPTLKASFETLFDPTLPKGNAIFTNKHFVFGFSGAYGDVPNPEYNSDGTPFNQLTHYQNYHALFKLNLWGDGYFIFRHGQSETPYLHNKKGRQVMLVDKPTIFGINYGRGEAAKSGRIDFMASYTFKNDREEGPTSTEFQYTRYLQADVNYNKVFSNNWNILLGLAYMKDDDKNVTIKGEPMLQFTSPIKFMALYGQAIVPIVKNLTLTLGLRYNDFNLWDAKVNGRAALVWDITKTQTLKFLAGTATRTPSYREWAKDMENTSFIQPPLEPEDMATYEISYNQILNNFYFDVTIFVNVFDKMLLQHETPPTPDDPKGGADEYFYNYAETVKMEGVEFNAKYKVKNWNLAGNFSYLNTDDGTGQELPFIRSWKYSLNADWYFHPKHHLTVGLSGLTGLDDQNDSKFTDDQPHGFTYVNVTLAGKFTKWLSYSAGARNVFGATAYDPNFLEPKSRNIERLDQKIWVKLIVTLD